MEKTEVRELWEDIVGNISCSESEFSHSEYFIGTIVLVGDDKKSSLLIVDGQQRLTTLTILLSAICRSFIKIDERKKLRQYIIHIWLDQMMKERLTLN